MPSLTLNPKDILFVPEMAARANPMPTYKAVVERAKSFLREGQLQEITVRKRTPTADLPQKWQLVGGAHRLAAASMIQAGDKEAGIKANAGFKIRANEIIGDDKRAFIAAVAENGQREDKTPLDDAHNYQKFREQFQMKDEEIAPILGCSKPWLVTLRNLLRAPASVRKMVADGDLATRDAADIAKLPDDQQAKAIKRVQGIIEDASTRVGSAVEPAPARAPRKPTSNKTSKKTVKKAVKKAIKSVVKQAQRETGKATSTSGRSEGEIRKLWASIANAKGVSKVRTVLARAVLAFHAGKSGEDAVVAALDAIEGRAAPKGKAGTEEPAPK